jgi:hypothetical protein
VLKESGLSNVVVKLPCKNKVFTFIEHVEDRGKEDDLSRRRWLQRMVGKAEGRRYTASIRERGIWREQK